MPYRCPIDGCDTTPTHRHNLIKHLAGVTGHGFEKAKTERLADAAEIVEELSGDMRVSPYRHDCQIPADPLAHEIWEIFDSIVRFRQLPGYSAETRLDVWILKFLPAILKHQFGWKNVEILQPEFPIRRVNRSYVDALGHRGGRNPAWFVFELKTDSLTFVNDAMPLSKKPPPQLVGRIKHLRGPRTFRRIREDLKNVKKGKGDPRFGEIHASLGSHAEWQDDPVELLLLYPKASTGTESAIEHLKTYANENGVVISSLTFDDLDIDLQGASVAWDLFREIIVRTICNEPTLKHHGRRRV